MKSRSIVGFVLGIISVLIGIPVGYLSFIILSLTFALTTNNIYAYSVYFIIAALILAIVGICFYLNKARTGSIFMFIAFILNVIPHALNCYFVCTLSTPSIQYLIFETIGCLIPAVLMLISGICGAKAKRKT